MSSRNVTARSIEEEEFYWFVENLAQFWPENAEHMHSILDPFWFYEFDDTMLVATNPESAGQIVGYVLGAASQRVRTRAYIVFVATHINWRRRGIASVLYKELFARLRNGGISDVCTAVRPDNLPSLRFHESLGFTYSDRARDSVEVGGRLAVRDYRGQGQHRCVLVKHLEDIRSGEED